MGVRSQEVDLVLVGTGYKEYIDANDPKIIKFDCNTFSDSDSQYQPTAMDRNFNAIVSKNPVTSVVISQDIKTLYWATVVTDLAIKFHGKRYAGHPQINHLALVTYGITGPMFGGAKSYAIDHFYEMIMLATRGVIDIMCVFGSQLRVFIDFEKNLNAINKQFKVSFCNVELVCGGTSVSPMLGGWFMSRGGKRIRICYTNNYVMAPIFIQDVDQFIFDYTKRAIGKPNEFIKFQIDQNNQLWVKNEIESPSMHTSDNGWFNTNDYVVEDQGQYIYKGRSKIGNTFLVDYENLVFGEVNDGTVDYGDIMLTYNKDSHTITVNAFKLPLYDRLSDMYTTLIHKMKSIGDIQDVYFNYVDPFKGQKGIYG